MRISRILGLGALAIAAASMPSNAMAAGYSHFTSGPLHFSVAYPSGWHTAFNASSRYETFEASPTEAVTINYAPNTGSFTLQRFTVAVASGLHKIGFQVGKPHYSGALGGFVGAGTSGGTRVMLYVITTTRGHGMYSISGGAPTAKFATIQQIVNHMVVTFTAG